MKTITICSFYNPVFVLELQDSQWYSLLQYFLVLSICKLQTPFLRTCLISFVFWAKKVVIYSVYLWVLGWQISARKFLNHSLSRRRRVNRVPASHPRVVMVPHRVILAESSCPRRVLEWKSSRPRRVLKYRLKIGVCIYLFLSVGRKMTPFPETVRDP